MPGEDDDDEDPELLDDENDDTEDALDLNEKVDLRGGFTLLVSCFLSTSPAGL